MDMSCQVMLWISVSFLSYWNNNDILFSVGIIALWEGYLRRRHVLPTLNIPNKLFTAMLIYALAGFSPGLQGMQVVSFRQDQYLQIQWQQFNLLVCNVSEKIVNTLEIISACISGSV